METLRTGEGPRRVQAKQERSPPLGLTVTAPSAARRCTFTWPAASGRSTPWPLLRIGCSPDRRANRGHLLPHPEGRGSLMVDPTHQQLLPLSWQTPYVPATLREHWPAGTRDVPLGETSLSSVRLPPPPVVQLIRLIHTRPVNANTSTLAASASSCDEPYIMPGKLNGARSDGRRVHV